MQKNDLTKATLLKRHIGHKELASFVSSTTADRRRMVRDDIEAIKALAAEDNYDVRSGDTLMIGSQCMIFFCLQSTGDKNWYIANVCEPANTKLRTDYLINTAHLHFSSNSYH